MRSHFIYRFFLLVRFEFYNYDMHFYLKTISIADIMAKVIDYYKKVEPLFHFKET